MDTTITLRGTARTIGRGAAAFAILTHEDNMAKATPVVETKPYRFVGRNHTHQGRKLEFGEIVELTQTQARNWAGKFRAVGADAVDAGQIRAEGRAEAERLIGEAQAEATARIQTAQGQAARILEDADAEAGRLVQAAITKAQDVTNAAASAGANLKATAAR